jgi:RecB family endonuclease NucS
MVKRGTEAVSYSNRPPVWQMVRDAAQQLNGECTYSMIKAKVKSMFGDDVNDSSMTCSIISGSVNHPSRIHYNENKKPRLTDTSYDYLLNTGRGKVVWYQPEKHGVWEIAQSAHGALIVRLADGVGENPSSIVETIETTDEAYGMFALEAHLRDYLAKKLPQLPGLDAPLTLYRTDDRDGVEFQTDVGPIDILATGNGDFYVLELKVGRGPDAALGQILRYMGWVKEHLAGEKNVYGVIVASDINQKLRYAATQVPNVRLMEYDLTVMLRSVALHG